MIAAAMNDLFEEIAVESTLEGSLEPSLLWMPPGDAPPEALVVGLHTWSADRFNQREAMLPFCEARGWGLLLPEFRGPNLTSNPRALEAAGGPPARRDVLDATRYVLATRFAGRTPARFLVGGSGGAHMALQVAGREAFRWDAVSSWCPITDLAAWQGENPRYRPHIEAVCGGEPGASAGVDARYREKSPLHVARELAAVRLQLAHGRHDPSVPYTHGWRMAQAIEAFQPAHFYFHLFNGGHEAHLDAAFRFFEETLRRENTRTGLTG